MRAITLTAHRDRLCLSLTPRPEPAPTRTDQPECKALQYGTAKTLLLQPAAALNNPQHKPYYRNSNVSHETFNRNGEPLRPGAIVAYLDNAKLIQYRTADQIPAGWELQHCEDDGPTWVYWFDTLDHALESLLDHQDLQILELRPRGLRDFEIRFRAENGDGRAVFTRRA